MPTLKYGNVKDVETDFKQAPIGIWRIKAADVNPKSKEGKGEMVEVRFEVTHDSDGKKVKDNFASIFYYAPLSVDDWGGEVPHPSWLRKLKELVLAFGLKATGGDLSKIEGKSCLARLAKDEDQDGEYRPRIAKLMSVNASADEEEEGEEDEGEEDEEEVDLDEMERADLKAFIKEQELDVKVLKNDSDDELRDKIREALGEDEDEEGEDEDEEDGDEDEDEEVTYTKAQLKKLKNDELKEVASGHDIDLPSRLTAKAKESLIAAILKAQEASDDEDEDEDDDEEEVDLDELSRAELKVFIKEQELDVKVLKNDSDDELRDKVREALGEEDDEEEEDEDEDDDEDNYDDMSVGDLREECGNRELETKGTKKQLVARLRKDDQTDPV